jgi:hypothetical protein
MDCAGLGVFGGPVFRRKSDSPELRARRGKFETDFSFVAADGPEKNDVALLLLLGFFVLKLNFAAAGQPCLQENKRSMRVDGKRFRFFIELCALRVSPVKANGHLH